MNGVNLNFEVLVPAEYASRSRRLASQRFVRSIGGIMEEWSQAHRRKVFKISHAYCVREAISLWSSVLEPL